MRRTMIPKESEIKRSWHLVDIEGRVLGRAASGVALLLMGKDKPFFVPHLDCGDYVVIINASKVAVTGRKLTRKVYRHHTGYPGGFREKTLAERLKGDSRVVIMAAVAGMLPKNKLRRNRLRRLKVFSGSNHPYSDKFD
ncbi:50S ribosomal protein L13 [Microgenomates group bacterium RIFCSPLOWO2_01_FULL_46_13]|nr:MAG: 50S ribosomal protein L13 [Microgenomates group bacterium RIFCSPHIGHO2_01_FULL_45_11]OGV95181.1 MAG: 50S ribosomal protein L13 [Microgenomates group bacterium RIFCSPLOWO2_01_FULL_46_13]